MSQVARGVVQSKVVPTLSIKCDRCGAEHPYAQPEPLAAWVCIHKVYAKPHGAIELPPLAEGQVETLKLDDELHVCGACWKIIEAAVQPTTPAPAPATTRYFVVSDYAGEQGHLPGGDPREHGEPFLSYSAAAAFVDEARKRGDLDYRDVRIEARPA